MDEPHARPRDARDEAHTRVGEDVRVRVLEPSPPAAHAEPWFADDPVNDPTPDVHTIVPDGIRGGRTWSDWAGEDPGRREWVADRWLGGPRRLPQRPHDLVTTRRALHRLAAYVIAPARHTATGRFGLRWTLGGFGTPFFGEDRQIRVDGTAVIDQRATDVRVAPITTLRAAADFLSTPIDPDTAAEHDSPAVGDVDAPLSVDPDAARFLGAWFGMAFAGLEAFRADPGTVDPSRPQLWPGHFDAAIEAGDDDHRASYGASPATT